MMGKPSFKSRQSSHIRQKKRQMQRREELADLQIQLNDTKKFMKGAGERVVYEINKCSRKNNNLVNWLKLYDEQIKKYEKEIYDLNLRLYFFSSFQPQLQPQSQPQSPTYKSMDDYFRSQKHPQSQPQPQPQSKVTTIANI